MLGTQAFKHSYPACATISAVSVSYVIINFLLNPNTDIV